MIKLCTDLKKYKGNISKIKSSLKKGTKFCAVVKANAYGLGAKEITKATESMVDCFAVAFSVEGLSLRKSGVKLPILQLSPYEPNLLEGAISQNITHAVIAKTQLKEISRTAKKLGKKADVQIKINSGMNRYGINEKSALYSMLNYINESKNLNLTGVFSHLSGRNEEFAIFQKEKFEKLTCEIKTQKHVSATFGATLSQDFHMDMVRIGIGMIGVETTEKSEQSVSFTSEIIAFQTVEGGEYVGYGDYYEAKEKIKVAIASGGYADGVNRLIRNGGCVIINNKVCKIVGSVCMDCFFVDVTNCKCKKGDTIEIFSEKLSLESYATKIKTIPYEALTQISSRVARIYEN